MRSKFIYAKTKEGFLKLLPNLQEGLDPIVFIEDANQIWFNGTFFTLNNPKVKVTEGELGVINIGIGEDSLKLSSSGNNITIKKGAGNNIIFSSSALSSIETENPLEWLVSDKKLIHIKSGVKEGLYGINNLTTDTNTFSIPSFKVNKWGHITETKDIDIIIRDYVTQKLLTPDNKNYNLLLAGSPGNDRETGETHKTSLAYINSTTGKLNVPNGINAGNSIITGDFIVKDGKIKGDIEGNVTGTATPKIHISDKPEYGGASKKLYGHVRLQDELGSEIPKPSSDNINIAADDIEAIAASPLLVWKTKDELLNKIKELPTINTIEIGDKTINTSDLKGNLGIEVQGGLEGGIDPLTNKLYFRSTDIKGYNKNSTLINIKNTLEFTEDFEIENNRVSLRWLNINQ